jgi:predicted nucleotidyltransferase
VKRFYVTGSRVYGEPRDDSDYDVLVDGTKVPYLRLERRGHRLHGETTRIVPATSGSTVEAN